MKELCTIFILLWGVAFIFIGSVGVLRLPDTLCRAHAISKALTFGISLMLIALWIHLGTVSAGFKVFTAILFLFLTIPLGGHIFALYAAKTQVVSGYDRKSGLNKKTN